jgi:hypothetical protein
MERESRRERETVVAEDVRRRDNSASTNERYQRSLIICDRVCTLGKLSRILTN